jgi:UDP-N-acetylmuramyl pentapeptide synthase/glycosyltransferase involved in cell wall biosynthesis
MQATVLHIITGLGCGGAERMLARLVLADRKAESQRHVVVTLRDEGVYLQEIQIAGIECHSLSLNNFYHFPRALLRLVSLMRRLRPDIVMTWLYHADFLGTIAAIASGLGTDRLVWNIRCSGMDFRNYAATTRWIVGFLAYLSRLPKVIAANSLSGQRSHQALGYRPRHWTFLPNGLDLDEWRPDAADRSAVRREWGLDDDLITIGLVARFDPQKDHLTFLAAADLVLSECPKARFILIGRNTEKLAAAGRILCLGERRDVPRLLRGLDILVVSSAYGEGAPNVLAEAMATEVACITTDVGDAASLVGNCGVIVPPRNPEALANAITNLVRAGPTKRARMGRRAREAVRRTYSLERSIRRYHQLWRDLLAEDTSRWVKTEDPLDAAPPTMPPAESARGRRPALAWGFGADPAELARITGGQWLKAPRDTWRSRRLCFGTRMVCGESLIIPKVATFRLAGADLSRVPHARKASSALLVDTSYADRSELPRLVVPSVSDAVAAIAVESRNNYAGTIFAVTGSVGKTSTCTLLRHALLRLGSCAESYFDMNIKDGLTAQMANLASERFAVLEVALGAIESCGPIIRPHVAVLTAVAPAHLAYKSTRTLARTAEHKAKIFSYLAPGGAAVINRSVPFYERVIEIARDHAGTIISYGDHPDASVRLTDFALDRQEVAANVAGRETRYQLGMIGRHMAINSLAVVAALSALDLDWHKAVSEFAYALQPRGRGRRYAVAIHGKRVLLIDDAYNANPASMSAAIELLSQLAPPPGGRRIAVLADMLELGPEAPRYHAELAEAVVKAGIDKVYIAGELMRHLWDALPNERRGRSSPTAEGLTRILEKESRDGDIILFKGSHATGLSGVVRTMRERSEPVVRQRAPAAIWRSRAGPERPAQTVAAASCQSPSPINAWWTRGSKRADKRTSPGTPDRDRRDR